MTLSGVNHDREQVRSQLCRGFSPPPSLITLVAFLNQLCSDLSERSLALCQPCHSDWMKHTAQERGGGQAWLVIPSPFDGERVGFPTQASLCSSFPHTRDGCPHGLSLVASLIDLPAFWRVVVQMNWILPRLWQSTHLSQNATEPHVAVNQGKRALQASPHSISAIPAHGKGVRTI